MAEPVAAIALSQLVLWYDATRVQTWPELLARVPAGTVLASATDFGRRFETGRMTDSRHAAAEKVTRNLPGLERQGQRLVLRGVGLLEPTTGGYHVSDEGLALARAYREAPRGTTWVRLLCRQLLRREPRVRALVKRLSSPDAVLRFQRPGWFAGRLGAARIDSDAGAVAPFAAKDGKVPCLRDLMADDARWALGAWQDHPLLDGATAFRFVGALKPNFSLHDIGLALRAAFEAFLQLGVLRTAEAECTLDEARAARTLGEDLAAEFGWTAEAPVPELLARLVDELRSDTGYVVASELRAALKRNGVRDPDRELAELIRAGRVRIEAEDYGQKRHGTGLFGESRKQLVKLSVQSGDRQ
jgi:hypothetical protein